MCVPKNVGNLLLNEKLFFVLLLYNLHIIFNPYECNCFETDVKQYTTNSFEKFTKKNENVLTIWLIVGV